MCDLQINDKNRRCSFIHLSHGDVMHMHRSSKDMSFLLDRSYSELLKSRNKTAKWKKTTKKLVNYPQLIQMS